MSGLALQMRYRLSQIARKHGTPAPVPQRVPRLPDCDGAQILHGYASAPVVDLERIKFRKYALRWLPWQLPELRYRHGSEIVGTVDHLEETARGLAVRVTTAHELAKCAPAFSVAAAVDDYAICDADGPGFHALIKAAWITEISLTDTPACPAACVWERQPRCPEVAYYDLMIRRVGLLQQLVQSMETRT
jgi:hypothetical protein